MSAGETKLLNNIISHAVIKFYTYFACCFNYRQLFWGFAFRPPQILCLCPQTPETSASPEGLTNQYAWGSVSDLRACVGFRGIKKVEKHWAIEYSQTQMRNS